MSDPMRGPGAGNGGDQPVPPDAPAVPGQGKMAQMTAPDGSVVEVPESFVNPMASPYEAGELSLPTSAGGALGAAMQPFLQAPAPLPPAGFAGSNIDKDSLVALTDPAVLCNNCEHGQIMVIAAPVKNRKADGSGFVDTAGYCHAAPAAPLDLEFIRPFKCSKYKPRELVAQVGDPAIDDGGQPVPPSEETR